MNRHLILSSTTFGECCTTYIKKRGSFCHKINSQENNLIQVCLEFSFFFLFCENIVVVKDNVIQNEIKCKKSHQFGQSK